MRSVKLDEYHRMVIGYDARAKRVTMILTEDECGAIAGDLDNNLMMRDLFNRVANALLEKADEM